MKIEFLSSTDVDEIKAGLLKMVEMENSINEEEYNSIYRYVYRNHTRVKKMEEIPLADKIRSLNLQTKSKFKLVGNDFLPSSLLLLKNLKQLEIHLSGSAIQYNVQVLQHLFKMNSLEELSIRNYPGLSGLIRTNEDKSYRGELVFLHRSDH